MPKLRMISIIHFLLQYAPFWGVPLCMIGMEYSYVYWRKSFLGIAWFFAFFAWFSLAVVVYYVYAGGPDKIVPHFQRIMTL